jgi:hypothetical protein
MNDEPVQPNGGLSDSDCEELLAGRRADLPVGAMLSALHGPLGAELAGEAAAMAAFRAHQAGVPTIAGRRGRTSARVVAAGIGSSVLFLGGVAAAASGTVRDDIGKIIGVQHHENRPSPHGTPAVTVKPTPSAASPAASATSTATSPTGHGKAHAGHGKGRGVGETTQPTHRARPSHPAHPSHPATPTHRAHPTKKPHPTQAATPTYHPTSHATHPTRKPHPTQAANTARTPNPRAS